MCLCFKLLCIYNYSIITPSISSSRFFSSHITAPPGLPFFWFLVYYGRSPYLTFKILVNLLPGPHAYVPQLWVPTEISQSSPWKLHRAPRQRDLTKSRPLQFIHPFIYSFILSNLHLHHHLLLLLRPLHPHHPHHPLYTPTPHQEN